MGWVIINGDGGCSFWQPVQADSQPKSSGLVLGRRPLGAILNSSNEPGELSQWLCHDDSTINIVVLIIIIIIMKGQTNRQMESEPLTGCKYNLYPLQQTWIAWSRTGPDVTRSNWANYLCIGNNRRIILYKYLLKQTIISRTIGSHYFLLNIVQFRLSSSYAVQASRIDRHSSNDPVSRRMYFALSIHRTLRRPCNFKCSQFVTWRRSFTWTNVANNLTMFFTRRQ